jgi:hypothetical protein
MLAAAAAMMALAAPASAGPWSSDAARLSFVAPDGWTVQQMPVEGMTYVLANSGPKECHILASPRPDTAEISPERIRAGGEAPIGDAAWAQIPGALPSVFNNGATVTQSSVDKSAFWPVQRADYNSEGRIVHGAIQFRPGVEFWGFCFSRTGDDDVATYDGVLRSIAATNDAELQANIEDRQRGRRMNQEQRDESSRQAMDEGMRNSLQDRAMEALGRQN